MRNIFKMKSLLAIVIILAMTQFACSLVSQLTGGGASPASNATQIPSAAQATQPASSESGNCGINPYLPVKAGATYTFAGTTSAGAYTRTSIFANVHADGFQAEVVTTVGSKSITTTESWHCTTDGLVEVGGPSAGSFQSALGGTTTMKLTSSTGVTIPDQPYSGPIVDTITEIRSYHCQRHSDRHDHLCTTSRRNRVGDGSCWNIQRDEGPSQRHYTSQCVGHYFHNNHKWIRMVRHRSWTREIHRRCKLQRKICFDCNRRITVLSHSIEE